MKITKIKVKNYRLLNDFVLELEDDLSLIIGKNNCGKTSLLSVLDKFIGSKSAKNNFTYDDFNIEFQNQLKYLVEINPEEKDEISKPKFPMGISLRIFIKHTDEDDLSNIEKVMMDLNPNNKTVVLGFDYMITFDKFSELKTDYELYLKKKILQNIGNKNKEEISKKYFDEFVRDNYKKYFTLIKKSIFFDVEKNAEVESEFRDLDKNKIPLDKIISFKFISAKREVANSDTDNTLSILSSKYYETIEADENQKGSIELFKDKIGETDKELDIIYETLFDGIVGKVKKFGGLRSGESIIKIVSTLKQRQLLSGNTTVMYKHTDMSLLPENYNGLGYMNLISMIFQIEVVLSEFRRESDQNIKSADINLLIIEEPEAHTHPQMQYIFIKNIKDILTEGKKIRNSERLIDLQTIITTHSSHIVSESDFDDIKYFYKTTTNKVFAKNLNDLELEYKKEKDTGRQHYKFLKQYLTLNRSELFFADKVIFIEGDTERILIPAMMKKIDQQKKESGEALLSQNISIVEVGNYAHIFEKFIDFIGIKSLIITDLDSTKMIPQFNNDSSPSLNKDGTQKQTEASCRVLGESATFSTNSSLNYFNALNLCNLKDENAIDYYLKLTFSDKIFIKNSANDIWENDKEGIVAVVYQIEEENSKNIKYNASSFEDCFIHLNRTFIENNIKKPNEDGTITNLFQSLKNADYFFDITKDAYALAKDCIQSKPAFAMEILLNSEDGIDGNKYVNWATPKYIEEGLLWLKKD